MKEGWEQKTLGEVCRFGPPKREARQKLAPEDLVSFVPMDRLETDSPCFTGEDDRPFEAVVDGYTYFADDDVLLAKITPCFENGKLGIAQNLTSGVGFGSSEFLVLRCGGNLHPNYLYRFLSQQSFRRAGAPNMGGAVGHKRIPKQWVMDHAIPVPPLGEQKAIVAILDEAFAAIDQVVENTKRNLASAREVFDSVLNDTFTRRGDDWQERKLGDVCELINGRAYKKTELLKEGKYLVLRVGNFFTNDSWYYSDLELDDKKYCDRGDLLYAWSASFGPRIWEGGKVIFHYHIWKVAFDASAIVKKFLYYWFGWDAERIKQDLGAGTTMTHVTKGGMQSRHISAPSLEGQEAIVAKLDALSAKTQRLEAIYQRKLQALDELKQSIQQKAFRGELTEDWQEDRAESK